MAKYKVTRIWNEVEAKNIADAVRATAGKKHDFVEAYRTSEPSPQETVRTNKKLSVYGRRIDKMHAKIDEQLHKSGLGDRVVFYSAYEDDAKRMPVDNLDEIAVKGWVRFSSRDFGDNSYLSGTYKDPTWLEVAVCANMAIKVTDDHHHVFLEGVRKTDRVNAGAPVYELCMGS